MLRAFQPKHNRGHGLLEHFPTWRAPHGSAAWLRSSPACLSTGNGCEAREEGWLSHPKCQQGTGDQEIPLPTQPVSPFSVTSAVVVTVCLPVWGRVAAHLKRCPDLILKARKRQGSNLTIKGKR